MKCPLSDIHTVSTCTEGFYNCFSTLSNTGRESQTWEQQAHMDGWFHSYAPMEACQQVQLLISPGGHIKCLSCPSSRKH